MVRKLALSLVLLSFASTAWGAPRTYNLVSDESTLSWKGSKVSGSHTGVVNISEGSVTVEDDNLTGGKFTIDLNTIDNQDIESPEWKAKLENHLKSDDFFSVSEYPKATFTVKSSEKISDNKYTVTGDLTAKGITKEISFPAEIHIGDETATAKADITINRLKWNLRYNSASFFDVKALGDKLIYDDIGITLNLKAKAE